jgi:hypothetical protein
MALPPDRYVASRPNASLSTMSREEQVVISSVVAATVYEEVPDMEAEDLANIHIVLVGDSTLDNGRYLNFSEGELSVDKQLAKRCRERGWDMTVVAQDGSTLNDVLVRQIPLIPDSATHIIISASGNDLLTLLNEMVVANFTAASMYSAIITGLNQVSERYRHIVQALKSFGCHLACCTVYRPSFNHFFFKALATMSFGLHNSRIVKITEELDTSVIDLANIGLSPKDFATPLELSALGGCKLVENMSLFVTEHPPTNMTRHRNKPLHLTQDDEQYDLPTTFGIPLRCCSTRVSQRRVYCIKEVSDELQKPDMELAAPPRAPQLRFSEEQECWREA